MEDFWECFFVWRIKSYLNQRHVLLLQAWRHGRHLLVFQQTSNKPLASGHLKDIKMSRFEGRFPFASRVYRLFTLKHSLASCLRPIFEATRGGKWQGDFSPGSVFSATPRIWSGLVFCFFSCVKTFASRASRIQSTLFAFNVGPS